MGGGAAKGKKNTVPVRESEQMSKRPSVVSNRQRLTPSVADERFGENGENFPDHTETFPFDQRPSRAGTGLDRRPTPGKLTPSNAGSPVDHLEPRRSSTASLHDHTSRFCSHCPHCKRRNNGDSSTSSSPTPPWLRQRKVKGGVCIDMDKFDTIGIKEHAHHQSPLTSPLPKIVEAPAMDYEVAKENYFTLPVVANTKPQVAPTCTPFPDYNDLQRKDRRANKPFSTTLFVE